MTNTTDIMLESINKFPNQFLFNPVIENFPALNRKTKFIVAGMGGSNIASEIIKNLKPELDITIHRDYGLPPPAFDGEHLIVCSSYSGTTEETLDSFQTASKNNLPVIAITVGEKLEGLARENNRPFILIPKTGIQPRTALGFSFRAMLKALGEDSLLAESRQLATELDACSLESSGQAVAHHLQNKTPVIYSSLRNYSIAYGWKIKLNETGKIPAFINVFPEMNHNEISGFIDPKKSGRDAADHYSFLFLSDAEDDLRIQKRMKIISEMYADCGLPVKKIEINGRNRVLGLFSTILLADWTAYYLAKLQGRDPTAVPIQENFKKMLSRGD